MVKRRVKSVRQTGTTNLAKDRKLRAKAPGKRKSKSGKTYYERRKNRSDVKGIDTPVKRRKVAKRVVKDEFYEKVKKHYNKRLKSVPRGYVKTTGASTAPNGYDWYSNGESRFSGKRKIVLVKKKIRKVAGIKMTKAKRLSIARSVTKLDRKIKRFRTGKVREPLRATRRHDLLPLSVRKKLPKLYATDGVKDKMIPLKLFSPYSNYTLYVAEFDGKDTFFGYVTGMGSNEWGYSSFKELVTSNRRGLPLIERDMYFSPKRFSKIKK